MKMRSSPRTPSFLFAYPLYGLRRHRPISTIVTVTDRGGRAISFQLPLNTLDFSSNIEEMSRKYPTISIVLLSANRSRRIQFNLGASSGPFSGIFSFGAKREDRLGSKQEYGVRGAARPARRRE